MRKAFVMGVTLILLFVWIAVPAHSQEGPLSGYKICLDPGHGGTDPGAVYDGGTIYLEEEDINLDVAYGLRALLKADGAEVIMTRTDDSSKSNNDRYTFCNDEQATILVSIHTNSTTDPTRDGSMALFFHKDDKLLADAIHRVVYRELKKAAPDPENFTDFGLDRYASGVLLKSDMPAAMMEPLFMSHAVEAEWLTVTLNQVDSNDVVVLDTNGNPTVNPARENLGCRRGQIAQAIHNGILTYFGLGGDAPPSVSITNPNDGDTVAGAIIVTADASDDNGVTQLEFFVDDVSIGVDSDSSDGWSSVWDTTAVADGSHTLKVTATDTTGQTASDSINVSVDNSGGGDGILLTATGYKVRGLQKVDLEWSGATSRNVDVYRDGALIATVANNGSHTDHIDKRGPGSYSYRVCQEGSTATCSNDASVTF